MGTGTGATTKQRVSGDAELLDRRARVGQRRAVAVAVAAAAAGLLCLLGTRSGVGLTQDSATYVAMSRRLFGAGSLVGIDGRPQTLFPPAYPALLAMGRGVGADVLVVARVIGVASAVLTVAAVGVVLVRRQVRTTILIGALAAVVVALPVLSVTTMAWSEGPYIAAATWMLVGLDRIRRRGAATGAALVGVVLLCGFAMTLRITGVVLLVPLTFVVLGTADVVGRRRAGLLAALAVVGACLPLGVWVFRNLAVSGTLAGERAASHSDLRSAAESLAVTVRTWIAPGPAAFALVTTLLIVLLVGIRRSSGTITGAADIAAPRTADVLLPWACYVCADLVFQLVAQMLVSIDALGTRLLAPLWPAAVVIAALGAETLAAKGRFGRPAAWLLAAWLAAIGLTTIAALSDSGDGRGYSRAQWADSSLLAQVDRLPAGALVVSDQPGAITLFTGRRSAIEPPVHSTFGTNEPGAARRAAFVRAVACAPRGAYLVWFDDAPRQVFDPKEVEDLVALTEETTSSDGSIFRIEPHHHVTC